MFEVLTLTVLHNLCDEVRKMSPDVRKMRDGETLGCHQGKASENE